MGILAIYLPSLGNLPVFDDEYLANGSLAREFHANSWLHPRVLAYGSFVWVQQLFGDGFWKQRLATLVLHMATVLALWGLYREILRHVEAPGEPGVPRRTLESSPALALALGAFALNPVAVYAVGYLMQRSIVMATLFSVIALALFARGLRTGQWGLHVAALVAYGMAVGSKEHAILLPLAALPLAAMVCRATPRRAAAISAAIIACAAVAGGTLAYKYGNILGTPFDEFSVVYLQQLAALDPGAPANAWGLSIENEAWLFFGYGARWLLPWSGWMSINLRPPFPVTWLSFPMVLGPILYLALLGASGWLVLRFRDWRSLVGLSLAMPALLFATEFATVWVQDPFVLYRSYLWAIGIPGLVFCLVHGPSPKVLAGVGAVVGGLLVWQGIDRVMSMDTPERAWSDAIAKLSSDPRAVGRWFPYLNRGSAYVERDEWALALRDFESSAALGDMGMGLFNTGAILATQNRHQEALDLFDRAQKQGYTLYNLAVQRGLSLAAVGRTAEAYANFMAVQEDTLTSPTREVVLLNRGRTALQLNKHEEAVTALEHLVQRDPKSREGRYLLGMAYVSSNQYEKAREVLTRLIADEPAAPGFYGRALANYGLQRKAEALGDIQQAMQRDTANPVLKDWEARIRAMPGKP